MWLRNTAFQGSTRKGSSRLSLLVHLGVLLLCVHLTASCGSKREPDTTTTTRKPTPPMTRKPTTTTTRKPTTRTTTTTGKPTTTTKAPTRECLTTSRGAEYRGFKSKTKSGRTCQRWRSQKPHKHSCFVNGPSNYCRNPKHYQGTKPWCYISEKHRDRWEICDIPMCPELPEATKKQIITIGGPSDGNACTFPFVLIYERPNGKKHYSCYTEDMDFAWCYTGEDVSDDIGWGYCPNERARYMFKCTFETKEGLPTMCGMTQAKKRDFNWKLRGEVKPFDGNFYLYADMRQNWGSQGSILTPPIYDQMVSGNTYVSFHHRVMDPLKFGVGYIRIFIRHKGKADWIFNSKYLRNRHWVYWKIFAPLEEGDQFGIRFERCHLGSARIAIDHLIVYLVY